MRRECMLALLAALACSTQVDAAPVKVTLKPRATVTGSVVRLDDVAVLSGERKSRALLARIPIDPAPSPGVVRRYSRKEVRVRLVSAGLDPESFVFLGPEVSHVRGAYLTLSSRRLIGIARDEAHRQGIVTGNTVHAPRALPLHVGDGELSLSVEVSARRRNRVSLVVVARQDERERGRRTITFSTVSAPPPAASSRRPRRVRRSRSAPAPASLIAAGDPVRVLVRDAGIELEVGGLARGAGNRGELIRVRIPSTQRTLGARVLGPGRVLLETSGGNR